MYGDPEAGHQILARRLERESSMGRTPLLPPGDRQARLGTAAVQARASD